jgi:hypothetical protein
MTTIRIPRGEQSYQCWCSLQRAGHQFRSYRWYPVDESDLEWMAFEIQDQQVAVESVLRFAHP